MLFQALLQTEQEDVEWHKVRTLSQQTCYEIFQGGKKRDKKEKKHKVLLLLREGR